MGAARREDAAAPSHGLSATTPRRRGATRVAGDSPSRDSCPESQHIQIPAFPTLKKAPDNRVKPKKETK